MEDNRKRIVININNKIACLANENDYLVCGNNDYDVEFNFDGDWEGITAKTAVFVYGNIPVYMPFDGNICEGVAIENSTLCAVGVFAGDLKTTTAATINCKLSVRDIANGAPKPPSSEVYDRIMELLDKAMQAHTELPIGGVKGQVLKKKSDKDYDTEWGNDEGGINLIPSPENDKSYAYTQFGKEVHLTEISDSTSAPQNSIVSRKSGGRIAVGKPTDPEDAVNKEEFDGALGDIDKALERIIQIQNELIYGTLEYELGTSNNGDPYYIVKGIGTYKSSHLVIPDTYEGVVVSEIAEDAFRGNTQLTSAVIGKNILTVGKCAFEGCSNLTSIQLTKERIIDETNPAWRTEECYGQTDSPLTYGNRLAADTDPEEVARILTVTQYDEFFEEFYSTGEWYWMALPLM